MSGDLAELDHYMDFGDDYSYFAKLQANSRCGSLCEIDLGYFTFSINSHVINAYFAKSRPTAGSDLTTRSLVTVFR
jgi:hypothetical protein